MLRELYDEDVALELEDDDELMDEVAVRDALIIVKQVERERAQIEQRKRAVTERYDSQMKALDERAKWLRSKLLGYVEREGKVQFPDVGTVYSTATSTKVVLTDKEAVANEYGALFVKESFDETSFRQWAADQFERDGTIPDGCDVVPASRTLAIRKA